MSHSIKITPDVLSILPYISTTWKNINTLYVEKGASFDVLIVLLKDESRIEIPGLGPELILEIFKCHSKFVSSEEKQFKLPSLLDSPFSFSIPFASEENVSSMEVLPSFSHEPHQINLPELPLDALRKFVLIAKVFGFSEETISPKENCSCIHCQMAKALQKEPPQEENMEEVKDEDLRFKEWDITQKDTNLYRVTHPLDPNEHYDVFLGDSLGCTCGSKHCEHIKAVLHS